MADAPNTSLTNLVTLGYIYARPENEAGNVVPLVVNFDTMFTGLQSLYRTILASDNAILRNYTGTHAIVTAAVNTDVDHMIRHALANFYNRLRKQVVHNSATLRVERMNTAAPVEANFQYPEFLATLLSSVGSLSYSDGPVRTTIVFTCPQGNAQYYGFNAAPQINTYAVNRLINALRGANYMLTTIDFNTLTGAWWPTCIRETGADGLNTIYCPFPEAYYTNEDVKFVLVFPAAARPFPDCSFTISYVTNENVVAAIAALPAPPGVVDLVDAVPRPIQAHFSANRRGIRPAVAAAGDAPAVERGCYILGLGTSRYYSTVLASRLPNRLAESYIFGLATRRVTNV